MVDNQIFVVGGHVNSVPSTSVEPLLIQQQPQDKDHANSNRNMSCTFPNSSWRMEPHLSLSSTQTSHAVAKVGLCLAVAGGYCKNHGSWTNSVEVLDVQQTIVWSLPNLTIGGHMVAPWSHCLIAFLYWEVIIQQILSNPWH